MLDFWAVVMVVCMSVWLCGSVRVWFEDWVYSMAAVMKVFQLNISEDIYILQHMLDFWAVVMVVCMCVSVRVWFEDWAYSLAAVMKVFRLNISEDIYILQHMLDFWAVVNKMPKMSRVGPYSVSFACLHILDSMFYIIAC